MKTKWFFILKKEGHGQFHHLGWITININTSIYVYCSLQVTVIIKIKMTDVISLNEIWFFEMVLNLVLT